MLEAGLTCLYKSFNTYFLVQPNLKSLLRNILRGLSAGLIPLRRSIKTLILHLQLALSLKMLLINLLLMQCSLLLWRQHLIIKKIAVDRYA